MQNFFSNNPIHLLDPEGIAANRAGRLSEAQKQRLNTAVEWNQGCAAVLVLPMAAALGMFVLFNLAEGLQDRLVLVLMLVFGSLALVLLSVSAAGVWNVVSAFQRVNRDRRNLAIRQAQGKVSFDRNGYFLEADGRRLKLPAPEQTGGLLPGAVYRVFYLEESGLVLSAEEVFPPSPAQVRAALNEILAQANGFSAEDLAANRNGEVTPSQRIKPLAQLIIGAVSSLVALAFGSFFYFQIVPEIEDSAALFMLVVPALILAVFFLFGGWMVLSSLLDMSFPSVASIEGKARKQKHTSGGRSRSTTYYYVIGEERFQVSRRAYNALVEGLPYRIYYLPRTRKLVSIEVLDLTP